MYCSLQWGRVVLSDSWYCALPDNARFVCQAAYSTQCHTFKGIGLLETALQHPESWRTPGLERYKPIFTYESRAGVFCKELDLERHFRLKDNCTVFQAFNLEELVGPLRIQDLIWSSLTVRLPWGLLRRSGVNHSLFVSAESLRPFGTDRIRLRWVPGHSGILAN